MIGAREYAELFETGQYGRLYLVSGSHARGLTFHIYVLPKEEIATGNGRHCGPLNKDSVEVFGITGGNPGWTETYGWLHRGPWEQDFASLVENRRAEIAERLSIHEEAKKKAADTERQRIADLLAKY